MQPLYKLECAYRTAAPFGKSRGSTVPQRRGLAFERRAAATFSKLPRISKVEHNPWFGFAHSGGGDICSPDLLLWCADGSLIVAEVKLTWVPEALEKLELLYLPVVASAHRGSNLKTILPLVVAKFLTAEAPAAAFSISEALALNSKLLHWLGRGAIPW